MNPMNHTEDTGRSVHEEEIVLLLALLDDLHRLHAAQTLHADDLHETEPMVESTLAEPADAAASPPEERPPVRPSRRSRQMVSQQRLLFSGIGAGALLLCLLVLVTLSGQLIPLLSLLPILPTQASVVLLPRTFPLSTTLSITAVTDTTDAAQNPIAARVLHVTSATESQHGPTTGQGQRMAQAAQGMVSFYNAAPYPQTIAGGTILAGTDGVQVMTDAATVVPAGNPPSFGIARVSAHALRVGPQGNIGVADLNGLCCVAGISVKNTQPFTGGQAAQQYPIVLQRDSDALTRPLVTTLSTQGQHQIEQQQGSEEQAVAPVVCQPQIRTSPSVGTEAASVTVWVQVQCEQTVYNARAVAMRASTALSTKAQTMTPPVEAVTASTSRLTHLTVLGHETLVLQVEASGVWQARLSSFDLVQMTDAIAGMPVEQARAWILAHLPVSSVACSLSWLLENHLPTNPMQIQVIVVRAGASSADLTSFTAQKRSNLL